MENKTFCDVFLDLSNERKPTIDECRADLRAAGIDPDALTSGVLSRLRVFLSMNKLEQLEQNLRAARHTRRRLIVRDDGNEFTAIFWLPNGNDVRRWVGRDTDLCAAIQKAGTEYAVEMLAAHIFGNQPLPRVEKGTAETADTNETPSGVE